MGEVSRDWRCLITYAIESNQTIHIITTVVLLLGLQCSTFLFSQHLVSKLFLRTFKIQSIKTYFFYFDVCSMYVFVCTCVLR